jgi:hypothetical protein
MHLISRILKIINFRKKKFFYFYINFDLILNILIILFKAHNIIIIID